MIQPQTNTENNPSSPMSDNMADSEVTPMDEIIGKVDSYLKDPSLVTVQTLTELKNDLMDLKSVMDTEESGEPQEPPDMAAQGGKPDLAIMIHGARGGK